MAFPESPRVIYEKNPLQAVGCQLRFPPILRIGAEAPVDFQELVRDQYPLFEESSGMELPPGIPPEVSKLMAEEAPFGPSTTNYEFSSADENWAVTLVRDSLSLVSYDYKNWEDFKAHLRGLFEALVRVYAPAFFTGIRLTYTNVIERSSLGLENTRWSELLQPFIACELASGVSEQVRGIRTEAVIELSEAVGMVRMRHGLAENQETGEVGYMILNDFYTDERSEIDEATRILNVFNRQAGYAFRWCIEETLHKALGSNSG